MAEKIEMPKLSDTMEEGVIAKWNVKEGDKVESGDVIAEVDTDKATMEVEIFDSGTILKILVQEGETVPLGGLIAVIGEEDEDISDLLKESSPAGDNNGENASEPTPAGDTQGGKDGTDGEQQTSVKKNGTADTAAENGRIKASPLARKMAESRGINLREVDGSGPDGRIIKRDIESFQKKPGHAQPVNMISREESEDIRVSQMRKTIARRLSESKFDSPHFYETIDIDMKQAVMSRDRVNQISDVKISFNDIVVKACASALRKHPDVNSSWLGDTIRRHGDVHIAVAVAIDEGLLTPVIKHTDKKGLSVISAETRELAALARDKKLQPDQMEGSTFTISNLGMFGIEEFTAIINPPNACILAVGAIRDVPVVEDGEVVAGKRMKVTLSSDHRVVDGARAAQFLNTLRLMLENPLGLVL